MLKSIFERVNKGMQWFLVIPSAILILALSWLVISYTCIMMHSNKVDVKIGQIEIGSKVRDVSAGLQNFSDYLDQQQTAVHRELDKVTAKLKLATTNPTAFEAQKTQTAVTGLTQAVNGLKIASDKISDQQKNIKSLRDEVEQLKQELKRNPS
jgi:uncharacterized protein (DUF3084 family)